MKQETEKKINSVVIKVILFAVAMPILCVVLPLFCIIYGGARQIIKGAQGKL